MGRVKKEKSEAKTGNKNLKKEFKKKAVRVRDRKGNISEQKLACPICGTDNKTYRVLVQHCRSSHLGLQLDLSCRFLECGWNCAFSILCFQHHMKFDHKVKVDWTYPLFLVQGNGDFSSHSGICIEVMNERNIPNQEEIKLRMELEYCRKEAKRLISFSYKMGRSLLSDVCEEFPKEDYPILLEIYDHETYLKLTKKYPMPDHMILDNLLNPAPNKWNRLVAENIAIHIFKERAEARIEEL